MIVIFNMPLNLQVNVQLLFFNIEHNLQANVQLFYLIKGKLEFYRILGRVRLLEKQNIQC